MTQPQLPERNRRARLPVIWFTRHQNFAFANSFVSISAGSTQQQTQVHSVIALVIVVGPQPDNLGQNLLCLCRFSMRNQQVVGSNPTAGSPHNVFKSEIWAKSFAIHADVFLLGVSRT